MGSRSKSPVPAASIETDLKKGFQVGFFRIKILIANVPWYQIRHVLAYSPCFWRGVEATLHSTDRNRCVVGFV